MKLSDMKKLSNALAAGIIDLKSSIEKRTEEDREVILITMPCCSCF